VIGAVQGRILLGLIYYAVLLPFAVLGRMTHSPFKPAGWVKRDGERQDTRDSARNQY
jgi:hypothetical protein